MAAMHAILNARVQLLATALNNVAFAFVVEGYVAPLVTGHLRSATEGLVTPAWVGFGVVPHIAAQLVLGRLGQ